MERGRVRCACKEHDRSSVGAVLSLMESWSVGCRPVGCRKVDVKVEWIGWCRAGNEKSVGEGLVSSPTTVRKPPRESSSGSFGDSTDRMPTSRRSLGVWLESWRDCDCGGQNAVIVRAWEIVSKSMSTDDAVRIAATRSLHSDWELLQSLWSMYSTSWERSESGW
jgi:hypothetical protein